jgi:8-oxo-dGTP pyrophosphatase MutT (NUDIX family)
MSHRWKPSVTVAAIVASRIDGQTRYLLVEEDTPEGLMLNNPAGHLDPAESPLQGVVREALEETAREFVPEYLVGIYMSRFQRLDSRAASARVVEDVTYLRFAYAGTVGEPDPLRRLDDGIVRTIWMSLDELRGCRERHRSALVLRCIEDHAAGRRFPLDLLSVDCSLHSPEIKLPR